MTHRTDWRTRGYCGGEIIQIELEPIEVHIGWYGIRQLRRYYYVCLRCGQPGDDIA